MSQQILIVDAYRKPVSIKDILKEQDTHCNGIYTTIESALNKLKQMFFDDSDYGVYVINTDEVWEYFTPTIKRLVFYKHDGLWYHRDEDFLQVYTTKGDYKHTIYRLRFQPKTDVVLNSNKGRTVLLQNEIYTISCTYCKTKYYYSTRNVIYVYPVSFWIKRGTVSALWDNETDWHLQKVKI